MHRILFAIRKLIWIIIILSGALQLGIAAQAAETSGNFERAHQAALQLPRLHSLLISQNGELVFEQYYNGTDPYRPANMKSASKSVISALVGIAIDKGFIESVNEPIANYFPDLINSQRNAEKLDITIENLLTMQSGLETTSNRNYGRWVLSDNWVEFAIEQPLEAPPGTRMLYSTGSTHLLSAILTAATGQTTREFAEANLTRPMGYSMSYWPQDPQGIYFGGNDMEWTPRQMLRFGELYLQDGRYDDTQVISAGWIERSHEPRARSPRGQGRFYGYGWWLRDLAGLQVPVAWGYGGQLIFVVEQVDLVVVATSDSTPGATRRRHLGNLYDLVEWQIIAPVLAASAATSAE